MVHSSMIWSVIDIQVIISFYAQSHELQWYKLTTSIMKPT